MLLLGQSCLGIQSHGVRALKDPGHPSEPSSSPSEPFPSPVYSETVLAVNFEEAKRYFLDALLEIHTACTLMLARQAIIPKAVSTLLLEAISKLDRVGILAARYDGRSEDLFFYVQNLLSSPAARTRPAGCTRRAVATISISPCTVCACAVKFSEYRRRPPRRERSCSLLRPRTCKR